MMQEKNKITCLTFILVPTLPNKTNTTAKMSAVSLFHVRGPLTVIQVKLFLINWLLEWECKQIILVRDHLLVGISF